MRAQVISAVCLLVTGATAGYWLATTNSSVVEGSLAPQEQAVEAGKSVTVDLRLANRPHGGIIHWHAEPGKGRFEPVVTEADLQSTFLAPGDQGRVKVWIDIEVAGEIRYREVAFTYINVTRSAAYPTTTPNGSHPTTLTETSGQSPKIVISRIPPVDPIGGSETRADIEGYVTGLQDPKQYHVVLYSKTKTTWWIQPLAAAPYTLLDRNGQFSTWTHTGTEYAALLTRETFVAPLAIDGELPPKTGDVLDIAQVHGK